MSKESDQELDQLLVSPEIYENPYPIYHRLRVEHPVHWSDAWGCWVLTRYDDVVSILRDYRRFTNVGRIALFLDQLPESMRTEIRPLYENFTVGMPNNDPPEHTHIRGLVNKAFTPRVVEGMRPRVQTIVDELLDTVKDAGGMDVIRDFAYPLPAIVIAETLGVPAEDRDQFKKWSDDIVAFHGTGRPQIDRIKQSLQGLLEAREWLYRLIAQRRQHPQDDLPAECPRRCGRAGRDAQRDRVTRDVHYINHCRPRNDDGPDRERPASPPASPRPTGTTAGRPRLNRDCD